MLLWPRRLPFLQPSSQSRENRPQPSDVTSFGPFPSPSLSQWTWKRTTPTFWCDSVWTFYAEFFCPTWKELATKNNTKIMRICSDQTKLDIERADQKRYSCDSEKTAFMKTWWIKRTNAPFPRRRSLKRHCEGNQRKHWRENGKETESWSIWQKLSGWLGTKRGWNILKSSQLSCNCVLIWRDSNIADHMIYKLCLIHVLCTVETFIIDVYCMSNKEIWRIETGLPVLLWQ